MAEILPRYHDNKKIFASFDAICLFAECQDDSTLVFSSFFVFIFFKKEFILLILFSQVIDNINYLSRHKISGLSVIADWFAFFFCHLSSFMWMKSLLWRTHRRWNINVLVTHWKHYQVNYCFLKIINKWNWQNLKYLHISQGSVEWYSMFLCRMLSVHFIFDNSCLCILSRTFFIQIKTN